MAENLITCPQCRAAIPLSEALSHQIREQSRRDLDQALAKQKAEFEADKKIMAEQVAKMTTDARRSAEEAARKLQTERESIEKEAIRRFEEKNSVEKRNLELIVQEQRKKLDETQRNELELLKKQRQLEEQTKNQELELQRRLTQELKRVEEQAATRLAQEQHQKDLETAKREADFKKTIDELRRKLEQGSQQTQGEVVELEIENLLRSQFPTDQIEPVAKGIRGADVVQKILRSGRPAGTIIWEFKQTKAWSDGWIDKLKEDQRQAKADVAVLVTATLPKGVSGFSQQNGVWITSHSCLLGLAATLRWAIVQHAMARSLADGTQGKMKALYEYLSGPEFRQRAEAILDASNLMRDQLERERRSYQKNWSEREKLIGRVSDSLLNMHGDLQGLGASLQHLESLGEDVEALEYPPTAAALPPSKASRIAVPDKDSEQDEQLF